jgi:hypothetical protein
MKVAKTKVMMITGQFLDRFAGAFRVSGMVVPPWKDSTVHRGSRFPAAA